jgi:hypothetical protein
MTKAANFFTPTGQTYLADLTLGENYLGATCYATRVAWNALHLYGA